MRWPPVKSVVSMRSPPISSVLNEDLLLHVISYLDDDSDLRSFRAVCRTFLQVDSLHRKELCVCRLDLLPGLLQKCTQIESLDLSGCASVDNAAVALLLSHSKEWTKKLKKIRLSQASGLRSSGLEALVCACTRIEEIDVSYCYVLGDREISALSCSAGLRAITMDKCLSLTDVELAKVAIGCGEKLEKLSLKWCMELTDIGIDLLVKKCPGLKELDISYLKVTNESLQQIASLQKLEVLYMVGCGLVDDIGLSFLRDGGSLLQELDVSRCEKITSSCLMSVLLGNPGLRRISAGYCFYELSTSLLHSLKGLKNLNNLRIDGARVSSSTFQVISSSCKNLVEIGLSKCKGVRDADVIHLASSCRNLEIIDLTCCDLITDLSVMRSVYYCKYLVCLKLESCLITEDSLRLLGTRCLGLKEIDLTDCSEITDTGLEYLSNCTQLLSLKLGLCTDISDEGLFHIASKCSKLLELDLYRCTEISDYGLAALSRCKKLKKLNLGYCDKLTDQGMQKLGLLEELRDLELRGLNITSLGLAALAGGCKRLSELDLKHCRNIDDSGFSALAHYSQNLREINISYCLISDAGLCTMMSNLTCLQDAKLVNLSNVSVKGFEVAIGACSAPLKKLKLLVHLELLLSSDILDCLRAKGCIVRWG